MAADDRLNEPASPPEVLARRLRDAQRRVRGLVAPDEERLRLAKRLLAICDAAKRDIHHATARLETFLADLDRRSDTPSRRNLPPGD
jgi:hypothetical protein